MKAPTEVHLACPENPDKRQKNHSLSEISVNQPPECQTLSSRWLSWIRNRKALALNHGGGGAMQRIVQCSCGPRR